MFAIPFISAVPVPSLLGGTIAVPGAGAFIAALLIAALVGSALGVLRQATSPHRGSVVLHPTAVPPTVDHDDHREHREAA